MTAARNPLLGPIPDQQSCRESAAWSVWESNPPREYLPWAGPNSETSKFSAYNQNSERLLCAEIEAADFSPASLEAHLQALASSPDIALWMVPFRGISATIARVPVDLLYLDNDHVVLDVVESFPSARVSASSPPAASVLVLQAQTIASTSTCRGHRIILGSSPEMRRVLRQLSNLAGVAPVELNAPAGQQVIASQEVVAFSDPLTRKAPGQLLLWEDHSRPKHFTETPAPEISPAVAIPSPQPALPAPVPGAQRKLEKAPRTWMQRLLRHRDPDERRVSERLSVPGLVAYFFTGGAPAPHGIRDISSDGIYVVTDERWYLGTVIRITLTDQREPSFEKSFTLNARVVRWGNDGVGLKFVVEDEKGRRKGRMPTEELQAEAVKKTLVEQYLVQLRTCTT